MNGENREAYKRSGKLDKNYQAAKELVSCGTQTTVDCDQFLRQIIQGQERMRRNVQDSCRQICNQVAADTALKMTLIQKDNLIKCLSNQIEELSGQLRASRMRDRQIAAAGPYISQPESPPTFMSQFPRGTMVIPRLMEYHIQDECQERLAVQPESSDQAKPCF